MPLTSADLLNDRPGVLPSHFQLETLSIDRRVADYYACRNVGRESSRTNWTCWQRNTKTGTCQIKSRLLQVATCSKELEDCYYSMS